MAHDLARLEEQVRRSSGVVTRLSGERVVIVPATQREAARAFAVRDATPGGSETIEVSLEAFDRVEPPDPVSGTVRAGALASVAEIDSALRGWGLTLGGIAPGARGLRLGEWLSGLHAGLRASSGRLESSVQSLTCALRGGGLYSGPGGCRSAAGPALERLLLGTGNQLGIILEATLRAVPRADVLAPVHAAIDRAEDVVQVMREALCQEVSLLEVHVQPKARGFLVDFVLASHAFRSRRDRSAFEELVKPRGELRAMRRVYERDFPFEGELGWERLAAALVQPGPMAIYRIARESVVVAADVPVRGAMALSGPPEPLPPAFLEAFLPAPRPGLPPEAA